MLSSHFPKGFLLLEDGHSFPGNIYTGQEPALGEAVFNTSHTGYQEILTDPSYQRQIMVFTMPHIGNVGVNGQDVESGKIHVAGCVIRSLSPVSSSWRAEDKLETWLSSANNKTMLVGANTRAITLHLRTKGAQRTGIFPESTRKEEAIALIRTFPEMAGADLAKEVSCSELWTFRLDDSDAQWSNPLPGGEGLRIAVLDFGVKINILRELARRGCEVNVLPAATPAGEILQSNYDGVLLSNGPGDPKAVSYGIETVRELIGKIPLFGICLGHQLLSLAAGFKTFKLPFGHRGSNHPVRREEDKTVEITTQNHGFAVLDDDLPADWRITHINLNDGTLEGLQHKNLPIFSIQYHPEASPGPHDGSNYFDRFLLEVRNAKRP